MKTHVCALISGLCLTISAFAYEGHGGGYRGGIPHNNVYHNGANYNYHEQGEYDHDFHHNEWHDGNVNVNTWGDGVWFNDGLQDDSDEVIAVPAPGYYDPSCQIIDDCSTGTCVLVNTCNQ